MTRSGRRTTSVVLTGVVGQGVRDAAEALARAGLESGLDVRWSESPAPALRGSMALSQVRMGEEVRSPIISEGGADAMVALEEIEALRHAHLLARGAVVLLADRRVPTARMRAGLDPPPADVAGRLELSGVRVVRVHAEAIASELGDLGAAGLVMLGVLSPLLPVSAAAWDTALAPGTEGLRAAWREAFESGFLLGTRPEEAGPGEAGEAAISPPPASEGAPSQASPPGSVARGPE